MLLFLFLLLLLLRALYQLAVVAGVGETGIEFQGAVVGGDRTRIIAAARQGIAAVVVGAGSVHLAELRCRRAEIASAIGGGTAPGGIGEFLLGGGGVAGIQGALAALVRPLPEIPPFQCMRRWRSRQQRCQQQYREQSAPPGEHRKRQQQQGEPGAFVASRIAVLLEHDGARAGMGRKSFGQHRHVAVIGAQFHIAPAVAPGERLQGCGVEPRNQHVAGLVAHKATAGQGRRGARRGAGGEYR